MDLETLYANNIELLEKSGIEYLEVCHEPVLSYDMAAEIRARLHLTGIESKSLFLELKDGRYCMFITIEGNRLDSKQMKAITGSKPRICSSDDLVEQTGCVPHCACPFGHKEEITLVLDRAIFQDDGFLYSPGPPDKTIEILSDDIHQLLEHCPNEIMFM